LKDRTGDFSMTASKRVIMLGAPGVGKGTQAKNLQARFGWAHISTGDMLRDAVREGTGLGNKARQYMEKGELVPDDVIVQMVGERLGRGDCGLGFILDGFPRTVVQAEKLNEVLSKLQLSVDAVVSVDVPKDEIVQRLSQRLVCETHSHVLAGDPAKKPGDACPTCGSPLIRRKDDEPETIRRRLEVYDDQTRSLIKYYEGRKLLKSVNGQGSFDQIFERIVSALGIAPVAA
jgi:adenylate kinase